MKIALESATRPQLYQFAKAMQLDVNFIGATEASLLELIRMAVPGITEIDVADGEITPKSKSKDVPLRHPEYPAHHHKNDPEVMVNIASDDANGGSHPWSWDVGGVTIMVKRNEYVPIPYRHYLALENAVENVIRQEKNPITGKVELVESPQQSVRFSARGLPSDAEIADFHARTKDIGREDRKAA